jgi:hypothetical protein
MSKFSAEWLCLREQLDSVSRATELATIAIERLRKDRPRNSPVQVIDLGAGAGANIRYVAPMLPLSQDWLLVDQDHLILDVASHQTREWAKSCGHQATECGQRLSICAPWFSCTIGSACLDLATGLDRLAFPDEALVTASALLDLVSEGWLQALAQRAAAAGAMVWFALTYDGRIQLRPAEPEDLEMRELFNKHQLTDKGFGMALGPGAARLCEEVFAKLGYRTWMAPSDWHLGSAQHELQRALLDEWFNAACEIAPEKSHRLQRWRDRRQAHIVSGRSEVLVGHVDIVGYPREVVLDAPMNDETRGMR